jgi:hypothetical protein
MAEYYSKMKSHADEMATSSHRLGDEEFVAYILTGLDEEIYNSLVSSIVTQVEPISPVELYSQMLSYERRLDKQSDGGYLTHSSTNATSWGRATPWHGSSGPSHGRGRSHGGGCGPSPGGSKGGYTNTNNYRRPPGALQNALGNQAHPTCQVCLKVGHTASVY